MTSYLLIQSRDPFDHGSFGADMELAATLTNQAKVTLFLVQNAVLPARSTVASQYLQPALDAGVRILADEFSLRERSITTDQLAVAVTAAPIDLIVDSLAAKHKAIWL